MIELQRNTVTVKETLNNSNFDNYMYPSRYNNEHDMIRYFTFEFIDESEVTEDVNWLEKSDGIDADGIIYGIIPHSKRGISKVKKILSETTSGLSRYLFIIPKDYEDIEEVVREFNAVSVLRDNANDEKVLFEEYEVIYEDLREVIATYMRGFTRPEDYKARFIYQGNELEISRKAVLSEQMSLICDEIYSETPIINNEAINKNEITAVACNSRNKIVTALLRNELEPNLGLTGSGQEVSIMRSTLVRTGIWEEKNGLPTINMKPKAVDHVDNMLHTIERFILDSRKGKGKSFAELYRKLQSPEGHIGLRSGVIPIYLAAVIHNYKREVIISDQFGQVPLTADVLAQINARPDMFSVSYLDWDSDKERFVKKLDGLFSEFVIDAEKGSNSYDYVVSAMRRWYMALPKYAKESRVAPDGEAICKEYMDYLKVLKTNTGGNELLFKKLPKIFGETDKELVDCIKDVKRFYDTFLMESAKELADDVKAVLVLRGKKASIKKMSLASVIKDWCETLDPAVYEQLFSDGTERALELFRSVTNDDFQTIACLARIATDLRLEDWDEKIKDIFIKNVESYKATAEGFKSTGKKGKEVGPGVAYQIVFTNENGEAVTKRFDRVEDTGKGKLLHNQVTAALDAMGRAMSDQEKRQVLMEILKDLC